ncbi:MAG: type II secretion system protein [Limisphaerales bacterium]
MRPTFPERTPPRRRCAAFTLVELLVVVASVGLLASLLLPALSSAKSKAKAAHCLNNHRQIQLAWLLYPADHDDQLAPNGDPAPGPPRPDLPFWWAQGTMNYRDDHPDNTNTALLLDERYAQLGGYTGTPALYRCPADRSTARVGGRAQPRVRSISMNVHVGRIVDCFGVGVRRIGPDKLAQLPRPAMQFVFLDEHPDSIGGTAFLITPGTDGGASLGSYPGALHNRGASLSFADGHVESRRWRDARTTPPVAGKNWLGETASPGNPDVAWLQERTFFPEE